MLPTAASSQGKAEEHTTLSLISEQDAIVRGRQLWIGIRFDLQDGWHTYWTNPGDSGEPPRIEWQLPTARLLEFRWHEQNVRPASSSEPRREGFGSILIRRALSQAKVSHEIGPEGADCRIELPL